MIRRTIEGFAFDLVDTDGRTIEGARLHGAGGLMGDGTLATLNAEGSTLDPLVVAVKLLTRAIIEHEQTGTVRRAWPDRPHTVRIMDTKARPIACRPIYREDTETDGT